MGTLTLPYAIRAAGNWEPENKRPFRSLPASSLLRFDSEVESDGVIMWVYDLLMLTVLFSSSTQRVKDAQVRLDAH